MSHATPEHVVDWAEWELLKTKAAVLAEMMNDALSGQPEHNPEVQQCIAQFVEEAHSDLVEWCRSARDVLEAVAHG